MSRIFSLIHYFLVLTILALTFLIGKQANAAAPMIWENSNYGKMLTLLGIHLNDGKAVMSLSVDPTAGAGVSAPVGSIGLRDNGGAGEFWIKTGAANTAWSLSGSPTDDPNTFAGFDSLGNLYNIPGWTTTLSNGAIQAADGQTYTAIADGSPLSFKQFLTEIEVDPAVSSTDQSIFGHFVDVHVDRTGSNNDFDGGVSGSQIQISAEGNGNTENMTGLYVQSTLGTGTNTGTNGTVYGINNSVNTGTGYSIDNIVGLSTTLSGDATITNTVNVINASNSIDSAVGVNGLAFTMSGDSGNGTTDINISHSGNITGDFNGIQSNLAGTVSNNAKLMNINSGGAITNDLVGGFFNLQSDAGTVEGIQLGISGTITGSSQALFINSSSPSALGFTGLNLSNSTDVGANGNFMINLSNSGDSTNNIYGLNSTNTGNATTGSIAGLNISSSGNADNIIGAYIDMDGTATTSVQGMSVDVSGAVFAGQKAGLNVNGGVTTLQSPVDTSIFTPGAFFNNNIIGGSFLVASGDPLDTAGFGNNLGVSVDLQDTFQDTTSGTGLGYSINGFVNQLTVGAGVNAPGPINYMAAGAQLSGSGTLGEVNMFRAKGLIQTGSVVVTNMYGFKYENDVGLTPTNEWAFYNGNSNAKTFLAGDLDLDADLTIRESGGGSDRITIQTPAIAAAYSLTLPVNDGAASQFLQTDGSGVLSWQTVTAGDVSSNTATSVVDEIALFADTSGKLIKRSTGTGVAHLTSGVLSVSNVDLTSEVTGILPNANTTADSANTASAIVTRDGSGNFSAGTITAALTGNASTATALAANPTDCGAGTKAISIDASGNLTCSAVSLTADVSGVLPIANGGTNGTATPGAGAIAFGTGSAYAFTAQGTTGDILTSAGAGTPTWTTVLPVANGGTGTAAPYYVDAFLAGANPTLSASDVSSYTEITNSGLTLAPRTGSAAVGTMCSGTNSATSPSTSPTTCSGGDESFGIAFTIPSTGSYEVCATFSHAMTVSSGVIVEAAFQLIETPTNAQTITTEGENKTASAHGGLTIATGVNSVMHHSIHNCAIFVFGSTGTKGIRLMYEQDLTGSPTFNGIIMDAQTAVGQRNAKWTVKKIF